MKKLRRALIGYGGVKIGEYQNSNLCSPSMPDFFPVVNLLSLKRQQWRHVEHPFPACCNIVFRDRSVTKRVKRGGWERFRFDRVNSKI